MGEVQPRGLVPKNTHVNRSPIRFQDISNMLSSSPFADCSAPKFGGVETMSLSASHTAVESVVSDDFGEVTDGFSDSINTLTVKLK